ncbi:hypothetical protein B0A50_02043 [Salinomyces thailandicus]|uniref:Pre-rRNA-processing protein RIX1 n=1 Tax=Salinomyces thailandicus TaxID=706561 RepID=A0A4U0U9X8_9PEZI|nr:hypothetical protein B0A50_02043 [Salinomyces thailandica]
MAVMTIQESAATLRAATYRLSSTPHRELPRTAPQIAAHLWTCKELLSSTPDTAKQSSEVSVTVHRFKTLLATLLQDRTIEGRWSAVVLTKAAVEAGGVEVLSKSNGWVRSLLGILKKHDPPTTRSLAVITLTRIFMLTWDHSNLVREITTPALPAFLSACLTNAENKRCSASELQTILEAFAVLVPRHPTIFRNNETQIRALLTKIISTTPSNPLADSHYTQQQQLTSQRLLALLHHCTPKQGAANNWDETLKAAITAAHNICDRLFRSVVETQSSSAGVQHSATQNVLLQGEAELESDVAFGLRGWKGVYAGSERLESLIAQIRAHIETGTGGAVTVRLGLIVDLLARLFSVKAPRGKDSLMQANNQVSKEERDALFRLLPSIHVAAVRLTITLLDRFGGVIASIAHSLLADIVDTFDTERHDIYLRTATYSLLASVLEVEGPSFQKQDVADVERVIRSCCLDISSATDRSTTQSPAVSGPGDRASNDAISLGIQASRTRSSHPTAWADLHNAANDLLPVCLAKLDPASVSAKTRALTDRTAILTRHKNALVASVLNNPLKSASGRSAPSLLPLLAKQYPDAYESEALLRPRMPVIRTGRSRVEGVDDDESMADGFEEDEDNDYGQAIPGSGTDEVLPTDGGVDAPGSKEVAEVTEDLYSASPPRQPVGAQATVVETVTEKRRADAAPDFERSAKRMHTPPVAETLLSSAPVAAMPTATAIPEQPSSSFVTAPEPSQRAASSSQAPASEVTREQPSADMNAGSDLDENDLPPLTMDSSDEEDEEEEDEE